MRFSRRHVLQGLGGCACGFAPIAHASVLDTGLEPLMGPAYSPVDVDERGLWQSCERIEDTIQSSNRLLRAPELQAYTRHVLERLVGRPAPELRIYLVREASFNAAMFPTGMMLVHTGLMVRARNEAQFAAVLGHEAGHYFRKHTLEQYRGIRTRGTLGNLVALGASAAVGNVGVPQDYSWIHLANGINLALMLSVFSFSREMESEADAYGIALVAKSGYAPTAAAEIWRQYVDERKQSAQGRSKRYVDRSTSIVSTHPPTTNRLRDLTDTADHLRAANATGGFEGRAEWRAALAPHFPALLEEQIKLNDPGASLYLVRSLAQDGWSGLLRYQEGEIYRMRGLARDAELAAAAYAEAVKLADAPPEAWRAHGFACLKAGRKAEGHDALGRYLALAPGANDAAMVRFALSQ